ncbi:zinc-binding alcohol dehydrogenase family protein [Streptomyces sp. NPDC090499]|uniref:quinone oxidoreductase family protein n=1 Tax=Streptomyces sp. NPDC090499 TaxID=3365965 RepID=UPI00381614BE
MTDSMPALVGGVTPDWELRDVPVPTPGPGQVLVRVHAAGMNRADLLMLEGAYNPGAGTSSAYTAGLELAGEVAALGKGVTSLAVGDRVMGATLGTFARYALLDHRHLVRIPEPMGWTDAAALPVGLLTGHDALVTQAGFTAGQCVLVLGATTAVGLLAVQLAKALGATTVIGTTTSAGKAAETAHAAKTQRRRPQAFPRSLEPLWTPLLLSRTRRNHTATSRTRSLHSLAMSSISEVSMTTGRC